MSEGEKTDLWLVELWMEHKPRLQRILQARVPSLLRARLDVEDILQECYIACGKRVAFLKDKPEIPIFVKLRHISLQTLVDLERFHLRAEKRDARKEASIVSEGEGGDPGEAWMLLADTIASPRTQLMRIERQKMTRQIMTELSDNDKEILELRHFEDLNNKDCAAVLNIEEKAASIRYVRALKRFQELVSQYTFY